RAFLPTNGLRLNRHALNSALKVGQDKWRDRVVAFRPAEGVSDGRLADRFNVGGRQASQAFGNRTDRDVYLDAVEVLPKQALAVGRPRRCDLDLLGEPTASQHGGVDPIQMVRRPNQEDVMLWKQLADFRSALLDELGIVCTEHAVVAGQQSINLIKEDDRWTVLARSRKNFRKLLTDAPTWPPRMSAAVKG